MGALVEEARRWGRPRGRAIFLILRFTGMRRGSWRASAPPPILGRYVCNSMSRSPSLVRMVGLDLLGATIT